MANIIHITASANNFSPLLIYHLNDTHDVSNNFVLYFHVSTNYCYYNPPRNTNKNTTTIIIIVRSCFMNTFNWLWTTKNSSTSKFELRFDFIICKHRWFLNTRNWVRKFIHMHVFIEWTRTISRSVIWILKNVSKSDC